MPEQRTTLGDWWRAHCAARRAEQEAELTAPLVAQLENIARNTCTCEPVSSSIDPEQHGSFCNFAVASLAVDGRAVLLTNEGGLERGAAS